MRRIYPPQVEDGSTSVANAYANIEGASSPWVVMSMVQSIDGSTSLGGVSGPLGSASDQAVFVALRRRADLLLVGAATARKEGYRPLRRPGQRLAIVTASGDLPWDEPVYRHHQTTVIAPIEAPPMPVEALRVGHGKVDLAQALAILQPKVVLLEGGSSLNAQMLAAGLVDEICITIAPMTVLGSGPRVAAGPNETLGRFHLMHVLEEDGYLFHRYIAIRTPERELD
jgi:riboflavin biosynthesis pyrimidine reductase